MWFTPEWGEVLANSERKILGSRYEGVVNSNQHFQLNFKVHAENVL
jgi:hypothetical protein